MHLEVTFKTGEKREIELSSTHTISVEGRTATDPRDAGTFDSFSLDGVESIELVGAKPKAAKPAAKPA